MNKWGKMLQKELDKHYSQEMQGYINWYTDCENDQAYQWVFSVGEYKHRWSLCKATGEIIKSIEMKRR